MQYGGGSGLTLLASLISYPVFTRVFSPTEYGTMALLSSTVFGVVAFAKLGVQHAAIRFYPEFNTSLEQRVLRSSLLVGPLLVGTVAAVMMSLFAFVVPSSVLTHQVRLLIVIASPIVVLEGMKSIFMNFMRAGHEAARFTAWTTVDRYGQLGFALIALYAVRRDLVGFYGGWLVWNFVMVALLAAGSMRRKLLAPSVVRFDLLARAFRFGAPLLFLEFGNMILTYGDRYMVAHYLGTAATGMYAAAYNFTLAVQALLVTPLVSVVFPWASHTWTRDGASATSRLATSILKYYLVISVPIVFGTILLSRPLMSVLASHKYDAASVLLPPLILAQVLFGVFHICTLGLFLTKRTVTLAVQVVLATVLNISINFYLIPHHGLLGAAWATLAGYGFLVALGLGSSIRRLPLGLDVKFVGKLLLAAAIMCVLVYGLPAGTDFRKLIFGVTAGALTYFASVLLMDRSFRQFTFGLVARAPRP